MHAAFLDGNVLYLNSVLLKAVAVTGDEVVKGLPTKRATSLGHPYHVTDAMLNASMLRLVYDASKMSFFAFSMASEDRGHPSRT